MRTFLCLFIVCLLMSFRSYGQGLVITDTATTRSVCYNDGTITVAASGGVGVYTFSIVSGPSYPNISYPIALPHLDSVFLTLPHGQYTIKVTDGAGHTAFATATVAGTYTFPVINPLLDTITTSCINASTTGGLPPYHYSISSVGTNAGFGPTQLSGSFCHLCDGNYWVRVMDSCQNIYTTHEVVVRIPPPSLSVSTYSQGGTDHITVTASGGALPITYFLHSGSVQLSNQTGIFTLPVRCPPDTIIAIDSCGRSAIAGVDMHPLQVSATSHCHAGQAIINIDSVAIPPYTITGSNGALVTHLTQITFNSLPIGAAYNFTITDSCGHSRNIILPCVQDSLLFYTVCPFDSSIHIAPSTPPLCYPAVLTCLNCVPIQIDTIYNAPARLFHNIQIGVDYDISIRDQCGLIDTVSYTPQYVPVPLLDSIISCRSFAVYTAPRNPNPAVHFYLYDQSVLIDSGRSPLAVFHNLAAGTYQVNATETGCLQSTATIPLPGWGGACIVPMMDSSCTHAYAIYQQVPNTNETYTLVSSAGVVYPQLPASPYQSAALFDDVPVGSYNLVSDSGCSEPFVLPAFPHYVINAYSTVQCTGQAQINVSYLPAIQSCNTAQMGFITLLKGNQYIGNQGPGLATSAHFAVADTGDYVVNLYYYNTDVFGVFNNADTLCPIDTAHVHVDGNTIPNIVARQVILVCGSAPTNIPYSIFGGTNPYTVQILGYPTRTVNSNHDTFPNVSPGIYTMIVSDSCGISRSFSVSVIDTCSPICTVQSHLALSDTIACAHGIVYMQNLSSGATHYRWDINGTIYGYAEDTSFVPVTSGSYTITLHSYIGGCSDSSRLTLIVQDTLHGMERLDTTLCSPFSLTVNSHVAGTIWSDGTTDSIITISTAGLYQGRISNACGAVTDTINVSTYPALSGLSLSESKDTICENLPDSVVLNVSIDSSGPSVVFHWSTGVNSGSVYSSEVLVYQSGTYTVTADDGHCPQTQTTSVTNANCSEDSTCISGYAIPDIFSPNEDGKNDTFFLPHHCEVIPFAMHIYNRWGELVFESTDINKGWDGKYKGAKQPEEVYWLWLMLTTPNKNTIYRSGYVTLVR